MDRRKFLNHEKHSQKSSSPNSISKEETFKKVLPYNKIIEEVLWNDMTMKLTLPHMKLTLQHKHVVSTIFLLAI
ncbi:4540_t:CDS:1, partial [Gigaspora rosea]